MVFHVGLHRRMDEWIDGVAQEMYAGDGRL